MFPAPLPQTDPDELLRCRDSNPYGDESNPADTDLAHEVDNALRQDVILRAVDYGSVEIRVRDGIVNLYGHVVSRTNRQRVENTIRGLHGIAGIKDHLIADDRLLAEVSTALGLLEHTYGCKFFTGVSHGVVMLSGTVDDTKTRLLAEQWVAGNPNVRAVINSVRVRAGGSHLADLPFFQPCIGAEFFFLDGISGRVQQVIIDPDNRRVVAMRLQGRFVDQWQDLNSLTDGGPRSAERTLEIPMRAVRYLTTHSGFLNISSTQSNQYSEFNAANFLLPPSDWKPPYPYCPVDVLFPAKQAEATTQIPGQMESPTAVALAHQILREEMFENDSLGG